MNHKVSDGALLFNSMFYLDVDQQNCICNCSALLLSEADDSQIQLGQDLHRMSIYTPYIMSLKDLTPHLTVKIGFCADFIGKHLTHLTMEIVSFFSRLAEKRGAHGCK